jgi:hypothetical protein
MAMEKEINNKQNNADNWITDEELRERYPQLWQAAKEKVARIQAAWTPEGSEALCKVTER